MNRGLLFKVWHELGFVTALFAVGLLLMHVVLAAVLPTFLDQGLGAILQNPLFQNAIRALLGPVGDSIGPEALASVAWVHPVVLALLWAHAILCGTRVPAGEVDRGTVDPLYALPVSRRAVFGTEVLAWFGGALCLCASQLIGHCIGRTVGEDTAAAGAPVARLCLVLLNQLLLTAVVAGAAFVLSAHADRRGRAIGAGFTLCLLAFFWQVLGQFWRPAADLAWLGPMHYYQPHVLLQGDGALPVGSLVALAAVASLLFGWAAVRGRRRDLAAL